MFTRTVGYFLKNSGCFSFLFRYVFNMIRHTAADTKQAILRHLKLRPLTQRELLQAVPELAGKTSQLAYLYLQQLVQGGHVAREPARRGYTYLWVKDMTEAPQPLSVEDAARLLLASILRAPSDVATLAQELKLPLSFVREVVCGFLVQQRLITLNDEGLWACAVPPVIRFNPLQLRFRRKNN